jgi:hypothetical protein
MSDMQYELCSDFLSTLYRLGNVPCGNILPSELYFLMIRYQGRYENIQYTS